MKPILSTTIIVLLAGIVFSGCDRTESAARKESDNSTSRPAQDGVPPRGWDAKVEDVIAPAEMAGLVRGVRVIGGKGVVPAPVVADSSWTPVVYCDDGSFWYDYATTQRKRPAVLAAARSYGKGRAFFMGHTGYFHGDNLTTCDNATFGRDILAWLDQKASKTVCIRQPADLEAYIDAMAAEGYRKRVVSQTAELRAGDLESCGVLVFVAWEQPVSAAEVEVIDAYVKNGGGLWVAGTAWAYVSNLRRDINTYAANMIGRPLGVRLENGVLHDAAHKVGTMEPHTFVRLCRTTGADNDSGPAAAPAVPTADSWVVPKDSHLSAVKIGSRRLFRVRVDKKWGYVDRAGVMVIPPKFYQGAGDFCEGRARVMDPGVRMPEYYIDEKGQTAIRLEPYTGRLISEFWDCSDFSEGLARVYDPGAGSDGGLEGFIDVNGKVVIQASYRAVMPFSEGMAAAWINTVKQRGDPNSWGYVDRAWGYVDRAGRMVIPATIAYPDGVFVEFTPGPFREGLAAVPKGQIGHLLADGISALWGFIDRKGQMVIPIRFAAVGAFSMGLAPVALPHEPFGFIDHSGKYVIEPQFDRAFPFRDGLAAVWPKGEKFPVFINTEGKVILKPNLQCKTTGLRIGERFSDLRGVGWGGAAATGFSEGLIPLAKDGKFGYMDRTGKIIADFQFKEAQDFNGTVASVVLSSGKSALVAADGKIVWQEK